ncbi:MAG: hypothetical protein V1773_14345 [bacterium]
MNDNQKLLFVLNQSLADELNTINKYVVNLLLCDNLDSGKLQQVIEKNVINEMQYAQLRIQRTISIKSLFVYNKA